MATTPSVTFAPQPDGRAAQIQRVAHEIEGLFLREVLKVMRDSVPESGMLNGGMAGDIYGDMFDQEIAGRAGQAGGLGLAELIADQLGGGSPLPSIAPLAPHLALAHYRGAATGRWVHPLPTGSPLPASEGGRFGAARPGSRTHMGVDLHAPIGTPVRAVSDGTVERVERDAVGRAGRYIRIAHPGGIVTRYVHLDAVRSGLAPGDRVAAGDLIGTVGRTGVRRSGPHLHFTVSRRQGGPGASESYIDPATWLDAWNRGIPMTPANVGPALDEGRTKGGLH